MIRKGGQTQSDGATFPKQAGIIPGLSSAASGASPGDPPQVPPGWSPCRAHLEGGGPVEFGGVHGLGQHVGDVGDEFLQELAGFLQVGGVDDDLHKLRRPRRAFRAVPGEGGANPTGSWRQKLTLPTPRALLRALLSPPLTTPKSRVILGGGSVSHDSH